MIFSDRRPFQTRISIGPFTQSKFAITNNCNESFVLRVFILICFLTLFFFVLCVFNAFSHSLILFRVKVRVKARVMVRIMIRIRVRLRLMLRVWVTVKVRVRVNG